MSVYFVWVDQKDKVCSYKKSSYANLLLFFFQGEFYLEYVKT